MSACAVQTSLPFDCCPAAEAAEALSIAAADARGAVFTRREVVDFVLDLIGYQADRPLHHCRLLEPSAGQGDFLISAIERLLASYCGDDPVRDLAESIRAVEIHRASIGVLRCSVIASIVAAGHSADTAAKLADVWLVQGDFLLAVFDREFSHIVGNPPYLRQEAIPAALLIEYRARYATIFDRADLYVPFFERSLALLSPAGRLGFICSDRWTKNRYGGPLRALVTSDFHLAVYVDMVGTPAFLSDVIAYPAITVIAREPNGVTLLARRPELDPAVLGNLARRLTESGDRAGVESVFLPEGNEPWMFGKSGMLDLVRDLESRYPTLEEVGCKVGIGVATGADSAFIAPYDELDVEPERKLPLITTRDIREGVVAWRGLGVLNPFQEDGCLVDLRDFPRFAAWLRVHEAQIRGRNVARRNPHGWYRTIDRIHAELTTRPKLLIPDIKGDAHVVLEDGRFYPHHNLYYIVSDQWDLHALQAVLQSGIARLFVAAYSVRMHGGHLRFQAQYLRRIRLPRWSEIPEALREALSSALPGGDVGQMDRLVAELYGLQADELAEALRHI